MFIHLESSEDPKYTMEQKEAVDEYVSSIIVSMYSICNLFYMLSIYNVIYLSE